MSVEQRRYRRAERAKNDLKQTMFGNTGEAQERARMTFKTSTVDLTKIVMCPFCLGEDKLQRFLVAGKDGISQSNGECPVCHTGMRLSTLLRVWTAESFAEWVFSYRGFFHKITDHFDDWRTRLAAKGWALEFWAKYKELKTDAALTRGESGAGEEEY